jgi:hypothetical protein
MCQTNKKTTQTFRAVPYNGFTIVKKSPKIYSNTASNFSSDAGKQLLIANEKNRFRWVVLCLPQDGACIDLFENHSKNSLKKTYRMLPLSTHLFSHWSIPLKWNIVGLDCQRTTKC